MGWNGMQWPKCQETWQKYRLLISSPCQNLVGSTNVWTRPRLKTGRVLTHGPGGNWRLWPPVFVAEITTNMEDPCISRPPISRLWRPAYSSFLSAHYYSIVVLCDLEFDSEPLCTHFTHERSGNCSIRNERL